MWFIILTLNAKEVIYPNVRWVRSWMNNFIQQKTIGRDYVQFTIVVVNSLRPRQNGRHSPDDIFKCIFLNENIWILITSSLKFIPKGPINNIPALVQIMAWRRPGDRPLSEPMIVSLLTHIRVTRPQWVKKCTLSVKEATDPRAIKLLLQSIEVQCTLHRSVIH